MRKLLKTLSQVIWPAVIAVVLAPLSVMAALVAPGNLTVSISLGIASVTMALLAQRA